MRQLRLLEFSLVFCNVFIRHADKIVRQEGKSTGVQMEQ